MDGQMTEKPSKTNLISYSAANYIISIDELLKKLTKAQIF